MVLLWSHLFFVIKVRDITMIIKTLTKTLTYLALAISFIAPTLTYANVDLSNRSASDMAQDNGRKPIEIIEFAQVKSGDKVLDLLAGGGYYSELLSRAVGEQGRVTLQIPKAYLKYAKKALDKRLANDRLTNVDYLLSEAEDLKLESQQYDSAFLVLGFHDMFFQEQGWNFTADTVMPQVVKSLKPGGKLLLIDHNAEKNSGTRDVKTLHRIDADFAIKDMEKRGFKLIKRSNMLENLADDYTKSVFSPELRRKTDRFVLLFEKVN